MRAIEAGLAALLSIAVVGGLQIRSGAYRADFDATEDEPAHVVSSLMIRDYLVSGQLLQPWEFATSYYLHYPKVALLHWPPLFHLSEAIWMLASQRSRAALLAFQAMAGAGLAFSVFLFLRRDGELWIAAFGALLVAASPPMQTAVRMVSPDILLGAVVFWAAAALLKIHGACPSDSCGARRRRAASTVWSTGLSFLSMRWFWAWTLLALGIHGRAAPLLMLPVLASIFHNPPAQKPAIRRFAALLAIAAVYILAPRFLGQADATDPRTILADGARYAISLAAALSWPVLMLAAIGAALKKEMAALVLSCWIFHVLVKVPLQDYFLVTAIPAAVVLAASGARSLLARGSQWRIAACLGLMAIFLWTCASGLRHSPGKPGIGARGIVDDRAIFQNGQRIWLVGGTATFEGALIAEVALRDRAMEHIVLRGSKMLAHSTWSGTGYRMLYPDPAATMALLDQARVGWVAIRPSGAAPPHVALLEAALESNARIWQRVPSPAQGVKLFQRIEPLPGSPKIEIDLRDKLGIFLRLP